MPEPKARPIPSVDAQGRTLFEVEVRMTETRTFYFWAEDEKAAEAAGEVADESLADSTDFDEIEVDARPLAESELPRDPSPLKGVAATFVVCTGDPPCDIRPTAEVRAEELAAAEEAERERILREGVPDILTPDLFPAPQPG